MTNLASDVVQLRLALANGARGRELTWCQEVRLRLANVILDLKQKTASRAGEGAVASEPGSGRESLQTTPTLARRHEDLKQQVRDQLHLAIQLRQLVDASMLAFGSGLPHRAKLDQVREIRLQSEALLGSLEDITRGESDLLVESVIVDIGVGD